MPALVPRAEGAPPAGMKPVQLGDDQDNRPAGSVHDATEVEWRLGHEARRDPARAGAVREAMGKQQDLDLVLRQGGPGAEDGDAQGERLSREGPEPPTQVISLRRVIGLRRLGISEFRLSAFSGRS